MSNMSIRIISIGMSILAIVGIAIIVAMVGGVVVRTRPASDYYQLTQPLILEQKVYPTCSPDSDTTRMHARSKRVSNIDAVITVHKELFKINQKEDGSLEYEETGIQVHTQGNVTKGEQNVVITFEYPCDSVVPGRYIWSNIHNFLVRWNELTYSSETETFIIETPENIEILGGTN